FLYAVRLVPDQAAFCEHEWALGRRQLVQKTADHFLRMAETVNSGGVDPVDAQLDGVTHGRKGSRVILRAPAERPTAAADGPGAEAEGCNLQSTRAEGTGRQCHDVTSLCVNVVSIAALLSKSRVAVRNASDRRPISLAQSLSQSGHKSVM